MSRPQTTPLVLLSEYALLTNLNDGLIASTAAIIQARLRRGIANASTFIQRMARRRFDELIETRKYTALDERVGGALNGPYILQLDAELRAVTSVVNGDGETIGSGSYKLVHFNSDLGVQALTRIQLNVFSGMLWRSGGIDPWEAIAITGTWGYGGQWLDTGATLTTDGGSTLTVSSGMAFEPGMMLKADTEYIYIESVVANALTVDRAMNGSTQAAHAGGIHLYQWEALDSARELCVRLVQWKQQQYTSPLVGTATVGDFTFPVDINGLPKDLYFAMRDLQLARTENAQGV